MVKSWWSALFFISFVALLTFNSSASADLFVLSDHPAGSQNPPPYGLRYDRFQGKSGVFTWQFARPSFIAASEWQQAHLKITTTSSGSTVHIYGNMYGGKTSGDNYVAGKVGKVYIDFKYTVNVNLTGDRVVVMQSPAMQNKGTIKDLSVNAWFTTPSVTDGDLFQFWDKGDSSGESFVFDNDGHRLKKHPSYDKNLNYVGRGWLRSGDGYDNRTRDFLFLGQQIPEPSSLLLCLIVGVAFIGVTFRRRAHAS